MALTTDKKTALVSDLDQETLEHKIEIATQTLERNIGFVTSCDNKTSIVLTAVGVLLTIILTNDGLNAIFNIIGSCIIERTFCNILYLICFAITVFIMVLGMYNLVTVLVAKTSEEANGLDSTDSRIFFSGIINHGNYKAYHEKFYMMSQQELLDELIAQIYINADIATRKYQNYNTGLRLTVRGFTLFVVTLLIGIYLY